MTDGKKAGQLRRLHLDPAILVLVNVWDVASARTVAVPARLPAIATGSWPIAAALGRPDGEDLTRDEMLAVVARIVAAVDLPVTADLEAGYGAPPPTSPRPPVAPRTSASPASTSRTATVRSPTPSPGSPPPARLWTPPARRSCSTQGSTCASTPPPPRRSGRASHTVRRGRRGLRLPDPARRPRRAPRVLRAGQRPCQRVRPARRSRRRRARAPWCGTGELRAGSAGRGHGRARAARHSAPGRRRPRPRHGLPPARALTRP